MFKVECIVEDKKLAEVLRVLASVKAADVRSVPVVNAVMSGGKLQAKTLSGSNPSIVWEEIKKLKDVSADQIHEVMRSNGIVAGNFNTVVKKLIDKKLLKRTGRGKFKNVGSGK